MTHDLTQGRHKLSSHLEDLRGEFVNDEGYDLEPDECRDLVGLILFGLNPPDEDVALGDIIWRAAKAAIEYIRDRPCICPVTIGLPGGDITTVARSMLTNPPAAPETGEPCDRCRVLGRFYDQDIER